MDRTNQLTNEPSAIERLIAQGMWRYCAGETCLECWESLPEAQKRQWEDTAAHLMSQWEREIGMLLYR